MNGIEDPSATGRSPNSVTPEQGLETLSQLGDWLTMDHPLEATGLDEDLRAVKELALDNVAQFLQFPENVEAVAHVMDGTFRGSRDPDVQGRLDAALNAVADSGLEADFVSARVGDPLDASPGEAVLPDGADAAIVYPPDGVPVVLLSSDLGFRDMILSAQQAAIDLLVDLAQSAGLSMINDQVGDSLATLIRTGDLPPEAGADDGAGQGTFRPVISVYFDGEITDASMV